MTKTISKGPVHPNKTIEDNSHIDVESVNFAVDLLREAHSNSVLLGSDHELLCEDVGKLLGYI